MLIHELHYCNTNTYLIEGKSGKLLFDTGWAGTFSAFCNACGNIGIPVQTIDYILISHFHPDHMGIAQEIANQGAVILVAAVQKEYVHSADNVFYKENRNDFVPIEDDKTRIFDMANGSSILDEIGIEGRILYTPGHSSDSISLLLESGELFVGDLNPLYELELHEEDQIGESWRKLLKMRPKTVYYGHAKSAPVGIISQQSAGENKGNILVSEILRYIKKGYNADKIRKKTGADSELVNDVMRMYFTHRDISVQGILDRIEIKNR